MNPTQRVAVVQAAPVAFDVAQTLEKAGDLAADAHQRGARLTLFPEAFVSAYPRGLGFGAAVGSRSAEGREQFRIYWESAIDVPGPAVDRLAAIARANQTLLVIGVVEREGGTLYCTVLFFGPDGRYLGKHRKLMPTGSERLVWGFGDGSTLPVIDTDIGRVGAVICWENYMPLLRAAMYAKGIEIYCAPTADGRDTWLPTMRHVAQEGRCFVLSANQFARRRDYPADYPDALRRRPADHPVTGWQLHHRSPGRRAGGTRLRRGNDPDCRHRSSRHRPGETGFRRRWALRAPRRVPPHRG